MWMKEDISNVSCYKVRDYFSFVMLRIVACYAAGILLSICRLGPGLSAIAIIDRRTAWDTWAKNTVELIKAFMH